MRLQACSSQAQFRYLQQGMAALGSPKRSLGLAVTICLVLGLSALPVAFSMRATHTVHDGSTGSWWQGTLSWLTGFLRPKPPQHQELLDGLLAPQSRRMPAASTAASATTGLDDIASVMDPSAPLLQPALASKLRDMDGMVSGTAAIVASCLGTWRQCEPSCNCSATLCCAPIAMCCV